MSGFNDIVNSFIGPIKTAVGSYRLVRADDIMPYTDVASITVFDEGDQGQALKGVMTEEFWLNPPFGRPRNINFNALEQFENSTWVQICTDAIVDAVVGAEWSIVPRKKLTREEKPNQTAIDEMTAFFEGLPSEETFAICLAEMLPDLLWYDAGVITKAFPVADFNMEGRLELTEGEYPVIDLSVRDGRSFMVEAKVIGGRWIKFWQYSWINPSGLPTEFALDEIMYFRMRPSSRGLYGTSKLEIIQDVLNYLMDSTNAQSKLFENGLFIGGQIDHPDLKDPKELKRKALEYKKNLQGPKKAGKWLVTGGNVKVTGFPFNPEQMQWLDGQKWFAKLVLSIFKIAPSEIGWTEDLNRATGFQQMNIHKSRAIRPVLTCLENVFNSSLVWKKFDDIKFKYSHTLDLEDKMKQAQIDDIYVKNGKVTINELRERDGEPILDDEKFDNPFAEQAGQEGEDDWGWDAFNNDTGDTTNKEDEDEDDFKDTKKFVKGGPGSGIKGHRTIGKSLLENKTFNTPNSQEMIKYLEKGGWDLKNSDMFNRTAILAGDILSITTHEKDGKIYGLSTTYDDEIYGSGEKGALRIDELEVNPTLRGKGIGRNILREIVNQAWIKNNNFIIIDSRDENSTKFWESMGLERNPHKTVGMPEFRGDRQWMLQFLRQYEKAVSVGAISGEAGYAMTPMVVDGHIKTKKLEDSAEKKLSAYWAQVEERLKADIKKEPYEVMKGGPGSGIKGHRTSRDKKEHGFAHDIKIRELKGTEEEMEGITLDKVELGKCYDNAGKYLLDHPYVGGKLVHGTANLIKELPLEFGHGWVELPGNKVFDGTANKFFRKDDYYKKLKVVKEKEFGYEEMSTMMMKHETWGPWHNTRGITK